MITNIVKIVRVKRMNSNCEKIITNYRHTTKDIIDCQLMHVKDILATAGLPLSGSMCFGLSEAYDFLYWVDRSSKIPYLIMIGRSKNALDVLLNKFSIPYVSKVIDTKEQFLTHVKHEIDNDNIVLAYADRYYLSYLERIYNKAHFGNHMIAISGYRQENNIVNYAVNDVVTDDIIWCDIDEIETARLSSWKPFSPNGQVIDICINNLNLKRFEKLLQTMILESIESVAIKMLDRSNSGVNAMQSLAKELKQLLDIDLDKYSRALKFQLKLIASYIKEFEETHSFYRMTYSKFLSEAADTYNLPFLKDYSTRMSDIAEKWVTMSELIGCENIENISEVINYSSNQLLLISDMEKTFFGDLYRLISNRQNSI